MTVVESRCFNGDTRWRSSHLGMNQRQLRSGNITCQIQSNQSSLDYMKQHHNLCKIDWNNTSSVYLYSDLCCIWHIFQYGFNINAQCETSRETKGIVWTPTGFIQHSRSLTQTRSQLQWCNLVWERDWVNVIHHYRGVSDIWLKETGKEDNRSEERRVGKECRSRWSPYH